VVSSHFGTPLSVGTSYGHFGPQDTPRPGLGGCHHHPPYSILCDAPWEFVPFGWSPEIVPGGVLGLWKLITPDCEVWSRRGLNQSCSPHRDLSNDVSHSRIGHRELIDSRLLVVGSQTATLTLGPSFAHTLGCRCPNQECKVILDINTSRPFQWYKEHLKARCFGPSNHLLSFWESRKTPNSHFREWEFATPTLD
jgi:hypothetical protein